MAGRTYELPPKCAACDGYNLHAGVVIGARDRKGLERLCRYVARPPLAKPRLEERPDGGVRIQFKHPWSDGTEGIDLSRVELVLQTGWPAGGTGTASARQHRALPRRPRGSLGAAGARAATGQTAVGRATGVGESIDPAALRR